MDGVNATREEEEGFLGSTHKAKSETGQGLGTLAEIARGGQNPGFQVFISTPFQQWMSSRMGAWALLEEESHSSPRSGRSPRSHVWLRTGSDLGILTVHLLGDNLVGQRPLFDCSPTLRDRKYLGKASLKRGDNGASEYLNWHPPGNGPDTGHRR